MQRFKKQKKKVRCKNNNTVYDSIKQASKSLGITPLNISQICNRRREHIHGYRFEFVKESL